MCYIIMMHTSRPFMRHQNDAFNFLSTRGASPIFMEMRLGKTLTAIRWLLGRRVLVIAPYPVMDSWDKELEFEGIHDRAVLRGNKKQRLELLNSGKQWVVTNFESAERLEVHKHAWDAVVVDESIRIANPKSKITKYMLTKFSGVPSKIVLCGLPAPEHELQYLTQFIFCHGNFMGYKNYWSFRNAKYMQAGFDWVAMPNVKRDIMRYVHEHAFVLSRKDAGIGSKKICTTRIVKMNADQKRQYRAMRKDFEFGSRSEKNVLGQITSFARIAGGCSCEEPHILISDEKLKELVYLIKHELKGQKVLVWCRFKAEALEITRYLFDRGIYSIRIDGDVPVERRIAKKEGFEKQDKVNVAVLTIASSAKGQDWSVADTAIYYSNEYSNDLRSQSEDRICHPKKKVPMLIIDLLTESSIDGKVLKILRDKSFDSRLFMSQLIKELKI